MVSHRDSYGIARRMPRFHCHKTLQSQQDFVRFFRNELKDGTPRGTPYPYCGNEKFVVSLRAKEAAAVCFNAP
jgi:hypothetical protein